MLYYAQGDALVTRGELLDKSFRELPTFYRDLEAGRSPKALDFSSGRLTAENAIRGFAFAPGEQVKPFEPIGPGKPLTLQIHQIYTGKEPANAWSPSNKQDMLVTSAVKSIATFEAKAPALNILTKDIGPRSTIRRPRASEEGTPFAFYSAALLDNSLTLDLTFTFAKFPQEIFDTLATAFTAAAGIPIFVAHSMYLVAASTIARLIGRLGQALFDGQSSFSASEALDINWPGSILLPPGFLLITQQDVDTIEPGFSSTYKVDDRGKVVDSKGVSYTGDAPYVVISVDGTPHSELESWAPTAASATVLSRFLRMKDGQIQPTDILLDAVKLYNDFNFRKQVEQVDKQIAAATDSAEKQQLSQKREALVKNIQNELIRP